MNPQAKGFRRRRRRPTLQGGQFDIGGGPALSNRLTVLLDAVLAIFANGEDGFLCHMGIPGSAFQDLAGTIPAVQIGDPVARLNDISGKGRNAVVGVPSRPYADADRPLISRDFGRTSMFFNNAQYLVSSMPMAAAMSLAVASYSLVDPVVQDGLIGGGSNTLNQRAFILLTTGSQLVYGWGSQGVATGTIAGDRSLAWHNFILAGDAVSKAIYDNGTEAANTASSGAPAAGTETPALGALYSNAAIGNFHLGYISAALGVNRVLTASERTAIDELFAYH